MNLKKKKITLKVGLEIGGVWHKDFIVSPGTSQMIETAQAWPGADKSPEVYQNALNAQMVTFEDGTAIAPALLSNLFLVDRDTLISAINEVNENPLE